MTMDEALRVLAAEDTTNLPRSLEAAATVLRKHGIGDRRYLPIARVLEQVADEMRADSPAGAQPDAPAQNGSQQI